MRTLKFLPFLLPMLLAGVPIHPAQESTPRPAVPPRPPLPPAQPVVGVAQWYRARAGESLFQIARRCNTDSATLARLNDLPHKPLRPGRILLLPTRTILPTTPANGIVLNIPERGVYVFRDGQLLARYPAAVGRPSWQTPTGRFVIDRMVLDPIWLPPKAMVRREGAREVPVPSGPGNPLGDRWMGWSRTQVGFHTTFDVTCVGQTASHGCVRMYPETGHRMFEQVDLGMPIYSLYQPIKIGREGDTYYLSVSPDIYHTGRAAFAAVQQRLAAAGLLPRVNRQQIRRIAARQDGYPHAIARIAANELAAAP